MDEKVYGIDLGTTYSVIASLDGNMKPEVFEIQSEAERTLASAVYFQPGGDPVVGREAKAMAESDSDRVVQFVKRQIGKDDVRYSFDGIEYDPITVSSLILKRMKEDVESQGYPVKKVVITCPAYFGNKEKTATRQAGEIAGLEVLDIIHEPTAAALNYCSREFSEKRKIMVYDLGGGTFDITLLDFSVDEFGENAKISIIDSSGDDKLGGIDWDKCLFEYICEVYANDTGISLDDIDDGTKATIRALTEDTKKKLSLKPVHNVNIGGSRLEIEAEKFRERTKHLVDRTIYFVEQLLQKNSLSANDVDTVLLVGGSTRMPMIQDAVKAMFPDKGNGSLRVRVEDPDFAVAKGAAISAAMKITDEPGNGGGTSVIQIDEILSRSFGPAVFVDDPSAPAGRAFMIDNLLFIGGSSPAEAEETYGTIEDNQEEIEVPVYENLSKDQKHVTPSFGPDKKPQATDPALNVQKIGEIKLSLPPNTPKGAPIRIRFECGSNGLTVHATNITTGQSVKADIQSETVKSKEQMKEASKLIGSISTSGTVQ